MSSRSVVSRSRSSNESSLVRPAGRPRDPQLPRTWERDLIFARDVVLGGREPRGVLWVCELRGGERERGCYRLVVIGDFRLYVTNAKQGLVSGFAESAHFYDLTRISFSPGDRIEFFFKKMTLVVDDTTGTSIITTVWNAMLEVNYQVPQSKLPTLNAGAKTVVDEAENTMASTLSKSTTSPSLGMLATYRAACDLVNAKPRPCVERYIADRLTPSSSSEEAGGGGDDAARRLFDLGIACRDEAMAGKFTDADFYAISRALAVTMHFDAVALVGNVQNKKYDARAAQATLSGEAMRSLLTAVDSAPLVRRVLLSGVGLKAEKLDRLVVENGFKKITHWNLANNPGLGYKGLAKLLGEEPRQQQCGDDDAVNRQSATSGGGPERLERLECSNCGVIKSLPFRPAWRTTLRYLDATRCDLAKGGGVDAMTEWFAAAKVLEVVILNHCNINVLSVLAALSTNDSLLKGGVLRVLDLSLNRCYDDLRGCRPCARLTENAVKLERLALAEVGLPAPALDALLLGLNCRAAAVEKDSGGSGAVPLVLYLPDNPMEKKHGNAFFERLSGQVPSQLSAPLQALNIDRSHLGTIGLKDLFSALASSGAPYLISLSVKVAASKTGIFAKKRNHEEMARALGDVVRNCKTLERLYLNGGDGSFLKGDLIPALFELQSNTTLLVLDISDNHSGDDALRTLGDSLTVNETLRSLYFDGNQASASAIRQFARDFERNRSVFDATLPLRDGAAAARNLAVDADRIALNKCLRDMKAVLRRNYNTAQEDRQRRPSVEISDTPRPVTMRGGLNAFFSMSEHDQGNAFETIDEDGEQGNMQGEEGETKPKLEDSSGLPVTAVDDSEESESLNDDGLPRTTSSRASSQEVRGSSINRTTSTPKGEGDVAHRMKIFKEILESETNYVHDLGVICQNFLAPIEKHELLKRDEIKEVFGNVRELREIHVALLRKLRDADRRHRDAINAGKWNAEADAAAELASTHAKIFSEMVPFLQAYASYCSTYTAAIQLVKTLSEGRSNTKFANFVQKMIPQCRGLDLSSFLIKPPQRLCKYPLFFSDLLKHMGDSPTDIKSAELIGATLKSVQDVANAVNKTMAASGSMGKVYDIYKMNLDAHEFVSDLVNPARRFLVEGDVDFSSPDKPPKRHHFYLFNDLMLLCTPRRSRVSGSDIPGKYKVKHRFGLVDFDVLDPPPALALNANEYMFRLRFMDRNGGTDSVHWPADGTRAPETDFLVWTDEASDLEKLRSALQQACYVTRQQLQDMTKRRSAVFTHGLDSSMSDVSSMPASTQGNKTGSKQATPPSSPGSRPTSLRRATIEISDDEEEEEKGQDERVSALGRTGAFSAAEKPVRPPPPPPKETPKPPPPPPKVGQGRPSSRQPPKVTRMMEM